uniref:Uncharacterized protein n=1 Tax=Aegilops tauschii subsp. strangulata TaxID=200361 RepID=A0A453ILX9_AEGTS
MSLFCAGDGYLIGPVLCKNHTTLIHWSIPSYVVFPLLILVSDVREVILLTEDEVLFSS